MSRSIEIGEKNNSPDSTDLLFEDIFRLPTPTHPQNLALFEGRSNKWSIGQILEKPVFTDDFRRAYKDCQNPDQVLYSGHQRLVIDVAIRYRKVYPLLELPELVSHGRVGLHNSVKRFDYQRGHRFSTYAVPRIRGAIIDGIRDESGMTKDMSHNIAQLYQAEDAFVIRHGRQPTHEEMIAVLSLSIPQVAAQTAVRVFGSGVINPQSLNLPIRTDEGDSGELVDYIPADVNPVKMVEAGLLRDDLEEALQVLSIRERVVVRLRFGFVDDNPLTLEEIGQMLGVTKARVGKIVAESLTKLRASIYTPLLRAYLETA